MKLFLAVETSSRDYAVALGDGERSALRSCQRTNASQQDLQSLLADALQSLGARVSDIAAIGVDQGPGGLSSTRAGVAFANGLMFSLGVPIYPFSYFDIVAKQASGSTGLPLLCAVPAASGNAYVALIEASSRKAAFGPLDSTLARIAGGHGRLAIAGRLRGRLAELLPGASLVDTGIDAPDPAVLLELTFLAARQGREPARQAVPLNEEAAEFGD
jgi:tRNA threonylcarbamoyl adenosine modification protein YeaZ